MSGKRPAAVRLPRVSRETLARNRLIAALETHPLREHYCLLQADVAERMAARGAAVLGVTRPRSGRGKTLTAANLAISLALDGRREVLLVDLDLKRPSMQVLFGAERRAGIEDGLFSGLPCAELLFSPIDGLDVLPARGGSRATAQILRSAALKALLDRLKALRAGALVVVDLPPLANRGDGAAFESLVDAVLLVVEDGVTREADYRHAVASFGKTRLLGTVLNDAGSSRSLNRRGA